MKSERDDTVKQIQLFQRNSICDYKILLLSFAPNFRHFLHRQSAFRVPYWSVFDAIQEVERKKPTIFSFHNLKWPKEIEFVYTPFSILAMLHHERYAKIEFGEYGNLIQIDLYRGGQISRRNIYDDRGFISCTSVYENGEKVYDQYLTEKGIWKLCQFTDGHVAVNPHSNQYLIRAPREEKRFPFLKSTYSSMEEVIEEVLAAGLRTTQDEDIFCAAVHGQHLALLDRLLAERRTVFSVFANRFEFGKDQPAVEALSHGNYIVADSAENLELLSRQKAFEHVPKMNIPPYDTRIDPGISQRLSVQKVLLPVDHLEPRVLEETILYTAGYLKEHRDVRVHLFTRNTAPDQEEKLLKRVRKILKRNGYPVGWAKKENQDKAETGLDDEEYVPALFAVEQCVNELSVNKCVQEQRLLVDLADRPDLFLQISCMGIGIPQILKTATEYMHPGKNGRINRDVSRLGEDLKYYLESLDHWNQAAIQSYELGKIHTAQYLIEQWKVVIDSVENGTSIAVGGK